MTTSLDLQQHLMNKECKSWFMEEKGQILVCFCLFNYYITTVIIIIHNFLLKRDLTISLLYLN